MQLVLCKNRVVAHGENFLSMGGTVINTVTGAKHENATIAECNGCPSDIDEVGYEYHAGVFVPCAPYGKGDNNGCFMEVCKNCATPRSSGIPINTIKFVKIAGVSVSHDSTISSYEAEIQIPLSEEILLQYESLRYVIKKGSSMNFNSVSGSATYKSVRLCAGSSKNDAFLLFDFKMFDSATNRTWIFDEDYEFPKTFRVENNCLQIERTVSGDDIFKKAKLVAGTSIDYSRADALTVKTDGEVGINLDIEIRGRKI